MIEIIIIIIIVVIIIVVIIIITQLRVLCQSHLSNELICYNGIPRNMNGIEEKSHIIPWNTFSLVSIVAKWLIGV